MTEEFSNTLKINISGDKDHFYGVVLEDDFEPLEFNEESLTNRLRVVYTLIHTAASLSVGVLNEIDELMEERPQSFDHTMIFLMLMSMSDRLHYHLENKNDGMLVCSCQIGDQSDNCYIGIVKNEEQEDGLPQL